MIKNEKLPLGIRILLYLASGLLGIILFVAVLATSLIADLRIIFDKDSIQDTVREVITDVLSSPAQPRKAPFAPGEGGLHAAPRPRTFYAEPSKDDPSNVAAELTDQLIGTFYETVGKELGEEIPFTQEEFKDMINDSTVKDYIADKTAGLVADYFADEVTTTFHAEEVLALIDENSELIESITGEPLPADISEKIANIFDESEIIQALEKDGLAGFMETTGQEIPGLSDMSNSKFNIKSILATVRKATSLRNLLIGIAISIALIAAIIFINIRQFPKGLRRAGYPLIWVGMGIIPGILANIPSSLWSIPGMSAVRKLIASTMVVYGIILGLGLALVIAGIVLSILMRRNGSILLFGKKKTEESAAEIPAEVPTVELSAENTTEEVAIETAEEIAVEVAVEAAEEVVEEPAPAIE